MSGLSTHVLDTSSGKPAANIRVCLYQHEREIGSAITNVDGRCPDLLPRDVALTPGTYRLVFETGTYFKEGFYPEVSISFIVRDASAHYHVPLLISPFGFTTYRGS
jgi:5-hydroxyisourate hydrolase